ncbi:hypothetical protein [Azospirillum sp. TSO22-1]|uniref:hypothetical protein n=1 Tax=Azospirillum sp. TSO22-1 TaxID=716789 RepID=UPI000D61A5FF|nr:hypothetical protein [Azospirillum sp. TSO22-1]PWC53075.1 hypothetical protein TSO221_11755 [Azospirillum sp. TSO22-1]
MKNTPSDPPRNVSPYLLKRLRSMDEAVAEIQDHSLRSSLRRRRDALARRVGLDTDDGPVDA